MNSNVPASDIDLWSDENLSNPYPAYAKLRDQAAVVKLTRSNVWAITRYEAIRDALGDWATFSSENAVGFNDGVNQALTGTTLATDPPLHTKLRAALSENLTPRALRGMKDSIDQKAERIVRDLVTKGAFDGVQDLARELPLQVVVDLIGVKDEYVRNHILDWGSAAFNVLGPMNARTGMNFPLAGELYQWASKLTIDQLEQGSIGHGIFAAAERGEIPADSCGHIIHQYVAAGMDTTIATIGNALQLFGEHPDQYQLLRQDPSLIPAALNEVLRYRALMIAQGRRATRDVEIDDTVIPKGAQVAILFGAGNHDPRHYENPEDFLIQRNPMDHLSFGYGAHSCAGQGLARLEIYAVFEALIRHVKGFKIGTPVRKINNSSLALDKLPVFDVVPV
ncbi:MAG: cytochrome P450 [Rhodoferax sp.]|nr:cytochrome P450 [Rhodoferax sp.]